MKYSLFTCIASILFLGLSQNSHAQLESQNNIIVPKGFSVKVVGTELGSPRHLTISKNGTIYANRSKDDGFLVLKDSNGNGILDNKKEIGNARGTEVLLKDSYLYVSSNSAIFRYKLDENQEIIDKNKPELIVSGMADHKRDNAKPFVIDNESNIYVTIGSWNDPCRIAGTGEGMVPCTILDSAGGIWKYNANVLNQSFSDGTRYATGLKNSVAIDWNFETNSLFAAVHGRGQFHDFYPQFYTPEQSSLLPAETLYELHEGADAGWPNVYYDHFQKKKMLTPEYGGDGKKEAGDDILSPIVGFPAHLGPNDLLFYTGNSFPKKYRNGAFIAFHGQSAELKKGYFVAFVPFKNGKPSGKWEIFADNFAGVDLANPTGPIQHRPCGLAMGPNGELYVCDDLNGTIFKISYK
ncbi:Glucose / Sorbosone dehydrogenase [Spirosomataceae bacterium TFI 002]|nr:Glucose / Sorbosone dehydrogenase [Spirosomataceae bacterium TFI 002]